MGQEPRFFVWIILSGTKVSVDCDLVVDPVDTSVPEGVMLRWGLLRGFHFGTDVV